MTDPICVNSTGVLLTSHKFDYVDYSKWYHRFKSLRKVILIKNESNASSK